DDVDCRPAVQSAAASELVWQTRALARTDPGEQLVWVEHFCGVARAGRLHREQLRWTVARGADRVRLPGAAAGGDVQMPQRLAAHRLPTRHLSLRGHRVFCF